MTRSILNGLVALILIIVSSPIWIFVSALIFLESGRPIFFAQKRVGLNGNTFNLLKFRGMWADAPKRFPKEYNRENNIDLDEYFHVGDDPRVTKVGRFIRKTSVDELPNLMNVLLGDMNLVGPRPEIPEVFENYGEFQDFYIKIKPGITSPSKCKYRDSLTKRESLEMDRNYFQNPSTVGDLLILLNTASTVILRRNVL